MPDADEVLENAAQSAQEKARVMKELEEINSRIDAAVNDWSEAPSLLSGSDARDEIARARSELATFTENRVAAETGKKETLASLGNWFEKVTDAAPTEEDVFTDGDEADGVIESATEALAILKTPDRIQDSHMKKFQSAFTRIKDDIAKERCACGGVSVPTVSQRVFSVLRGSLTGLRIACCLTSYSNIRLRKDGGSPGKSLASVSMAALQQARSSKALCLDAASELAKKSKELEDLQAKYDAAVVS